MDDRRRTPFVTFAPAVTSLASAASGRKQPAQPVSEPQLDHRLPRFDFGYPIGTTASGDPLVRPSPFAFPTQQEANRIAEAISADDLASGHKLVCRYAGA